MLGGQCREGTSDGKSPNGRDRRRICYAVAMADIRSWGLSAALGAIALIVTSCASGPPTGPSPASIAGLRAKTILVSPFNIVSAMPPELEGSARFVSNALVDHLEAHGKTVRVIGYDIGRRFWKKSRKEVRDSGRPRKFENAAKIYARKIGEHVEFDAIIVPSLFVQNAKMKSRVVRWDGAEQKVERHGNSRGAIIQSGSVVIKAASLFAYVLDREGVAIHSGRAGLELIQNMRFGGKRRRGLQERESRIESFSADFVLVDNIPAIQDKDRVCAGVATVLSPFLPMYTPTPVSRAADSTRSSGKPADP